MRKLLILSTFLLMPTLCWAQLPQLGSLLECWDFSNSGNLGKSQSGSLGDNLTNLNGATQVAGPGTLKAVHFTASSSQTLDGSFGTGINTYENGQGAATNFTVSLWVNHDTLTATKECTFCQGVSTAAGQFSFYWLHDTDGTVEIAAANGFGCVLTTASGFITAGSWINLIFTDDGTTCNLYKNNGTATSATSHHPSEANQNDFRLGSIGSGTTVNQPFNGAMASVNVWNIILTASDRTVVYNSGSGQACSQSRVKHRSIVIQLLKHFDALLSMLLPRSIYAVLR